MALLEWVAAGLETGEINERAEKFKPPFTVTRQSVDHYRKSRKLEMEVITKESEMDALTQGLALKENRVGRLQLLASLMEKDLFGGFMWLEQVKSIGSGLDAQVIEYEEFNKAEVESYRGVLDDIAREIGDRKQGVVLSWEDEARKRGFNPDDIRAVARKAIASGLARIGDSGGVSTGDTSEVADPADSTHGSI